MVSHYWRSILAAGTLVVFAVALVAHAFVVHHRQCSHAADFHVSIPCGHPELSELASKHDHSSKHCGLCGLFVVVEKPIGESTSVETCAYLYPLYVYPEVAAPAAVTPARAPPAYQ